MTHLAPFCLHIRCASVGLHSMAVTGANTRHITPCRCFHGHVQYIFCMSVCPQDNWQFLPCCPRSCRHNCSTTLHFVTHLAPCDSPGPFCLSQLLQMLTASMHFYTFPCLLVCPTASSNACLPFNLTLRVTSAAGSRDNYHIASTNIPIYNLTQCPNSTCPGALATTTLIRGG